ncbi:MAG: LysR family transcriptional regulator [Cytophagaceae bacterium]|nr:LysR family transcriptional regulator [Gemmatimonadaceae bacterium]
MSTPDLNLLIALDVLLAEESVARAAQRLGLSPSAMSRTLARLREVTGDPLLVRAGRALVSTPRALELRERTGALVRDVGEVLRPASKPRLDQLMRTFTLRCSDGFVENFGPALLARVASDAPGVRLRFIQKVNRDNAPLREGAVDLETGLVRKATAPEFRVRALFRDQFVGVVRDGHALNRGAITPARYAAASHVAIARGGSDRGPVDEALASLSLDRRIAIVVTGFSAALALVRGTEVVATVPEKHTRNLRDGLVAFPLPFPVPELTVAMMWHPRLDADPAHQWLRECVRATCRESLAEARERRGAKSR